MGNNRRRYVCHFKESRINVLIAILGGSVPNVLHQVSVPIIDNKKCKDMFVKSGHKKKKVRESFLCAGYEDGKKDSCTVSLVTDTFSLFRLCQGVLHTFRVIAEVP